MDRKDFVKCNITFRAKNKIIPDIVFIRKTLFWHDDWDGILAEARAEIVNDTLVRLFLKPNDFITKIEIIPLNDESAHSYSFDINKTVMEIINEAVEKERFKTVFDIHFLRPSGTPDVISYIAMDKCHWEYSTRIAIINKVKTLLENINSSITDHCLIYRVDIDKNKRIMPLDHSEMFYLIDIFDDEHGYEEEV